MNNAGRGPRRRIGLPREDGFCFGAPFDTNGGLGFWRASPLMERELMRRLFAWPVRLSLLAGLFAGCGDDDGGAVSFTALAEQRDVQIDTICDCFDELQWASRSACKNGQNPIGPSMRRCADDALSMDQDAAREYLECYEELERNYSDCLDERLDCDDIESLDACARDYQVGAQDCIELSSKIERNLEDCGVSGEVLAIRRGNETMEPDPNQPGGGCTNTCEFANDGACDDGAPDAEFDACDLGTDCADCGARD